jgi:hypothetical protein
MKNTIITLCFLVICFLLIFITSCKPVKKAVEEPSVTRVDSAEKRYFAETPYDKIEHLKKSLEKLNERHGRKLDYDKIIKVDSSVLNPILNNPTDPMVYAELRITGGRLHVRVSPSPPPLTAKPNIIIPLGLNNFPWIIAMEKTELRKIKDGTRCKKYLFVPAIESGWPDGSPNSDSVHFTLCVLGSERHSDTVSGQHTLSVAALAGQETWPRVNYVWYR